MQPEVLQIPALPTAYREVQPLLLDVTRACGRSVTTAEAYAQSAEDLKQIKAAKAQIEQARVRITGPMNESLRAANAQAREATAPFDEAERIIKDKLIAYSDAQEQRRRVLQRLADEEARQAREKSQREAAAAREKADREAAELRAKAEAEAAAGRQAEAAKLTARAEAKIERAEAKAEVLQQAAAATVAPIVQAEQTKVRGVVTREVWKFEVIDPTKVAPAMMVPDEAKIRRTVAALKGDAGPVVGPGVRVWKETAIAAGAA
jgi:hypothetical protein